MNRVLEVRTCISPTLPPGLGRTQGWWFWVDTPKSTLIVLTTFLAYSLIVFTFLDAIFIQLLSIRPLFDDSAKNLAQSWDLKPPAAFLTYRTTYKVPIHTTSLSFIYGIDVILPIEFEVQTLQIMVGCFKIHWAPVGGSWKIEWGPNV